MNCFIVNPLVAVHCSLLPAGVGSCYEMTSQLTLPYLVNVTSYVKLLFSFNIY